MPARLAAWDLETEDTNIRVLVILQSTTTFGSSPNQSTPCVLGLGDRGVTNQAAESASTLATAC